MQRPSVWSSVVSGSRTCPRSRPTAPIPKWRSTSLGRPRSLDRAAELIGEFATGDNRVAGWFQYAIALRETDDVLIGDIGALLHANLLQAEIGFTLDPRYQGHGYAAEAIRWATREFSVVG